MRKRKFCTSILLALVCTSLMAARKAELRYYGFTDEPVTVPVKTEQGKVTCTIRTITRDGWGPVATRTLKVANGAIQVMPLTEGIHIVELPKGNRPYRFLAMNPPPALPAEAVRKQLPRQAERLLSGKPFTILAMGDSVTATGDYEEMLGKMLARATGNKQIKVVTAAYPGRSVDASVREFKNDAIPVKPQLGLLMYGLNDQICFTPLEAYLEQSEYIVKHLANECDADCILLQPTPHLDLKENPPSFAFRTIGFAQSIVDLGQQLKVPVVPTFAAIWGNGGETVQGAAEHMWALYPTHYSKQMTSMLEKNGKGDTIHLNCLGHLQMAKAVYATIAGEQPFDALTWKAGSKWTKDGVISKLTVTNNTTITRKGRLEIHPLYKSELLPNEPVAYELEPGASKEIVVTWPRIRKPEDLFRHPAVFYARKGKLQVPVLDVVDGYSHVYAVPAPIKDVVQYIRCRQVVKDKVTVSMADGSRQVYAIPQDTQVGRKRLITGNATAELVWTQFAGAMTGEAEIDGDLKEWGGHVWSVVGEPCQARWTSGPDDKRKSPDECYIRFAVKAGKAGMAIAMKIKGEIDKDSYTFFFDPRPAKDLGSVGPYYWCSGKLLTNNRVQVRRGETTKTNVKLLGKWQKVGDETHCEIYLPYALMEQSAWPADGDLGFSLVWRHAGPGGVTYLMWSEDGHPWNTRWYGVIRKIENATSSLPYRVRIK